MAEDLGERTEEATPKRRQEAREEGNVAKSHDLSGALVLLFGTLTVWAFAMSMLLQGKTLLGASLTDAVGSTVDRHAAWEALRTLGVGALRLLLPVLLLLWVASCASQLVQVGLLFTPKAVAPAFKKLNPINGFKRIFGISGVFKSGLDALKVGLIVAVAGMAVASYSSAIAALPYLGALQAAREAGLMMIDVALRALAVLLLLGFMDFLYQRWKHSRDLRMTKQQVKDEMKETEGDPETKRRRARIARQMAMQRISAAVPKADVIVTNPEHISVAIKYDPANMAAPKVIAKGADHLALRIRILAMQHGIPIIERKPLARALYRQVEVNQEIPAEFYKAIAEILAYVYRLSGRKVA
jgi:flagellar biosynthetic protein FlhB